VGKAFGGTLNDVAATIVDAGLTRYLKDRSLLPREPLVAMCPLSLREAGDKEAATKVSALFVPLGQPDAAIGARMDQVMRASQSAKDELRALSKDAAMLYAILAFGLGEVVDAIGTGTMARPIANFVLSNVPGPRHDMYLRGARMIGIFPVSALGAGIGLNVTLLSYSTTMDFGFVGNGTSMPALDELARHTQAAFAALKHEAAKRHPAPSSAAKSAAPTAAKPASRRTKTAHRAAHTRNRRPAPAT
jgi:WS/DGAT/MGAT family acyltransferase